MTNDPQSSSPRREPKRVPPIVVVFLGVGIGFLVANWMGAALGGLLGVIIWWGRIRS